MPQFMILADDYIDDDAINRRLAVRNDHLQRMTVEKANGKFIIGGAQLNDKDKMTGSMLIVEMESIEEVNEWIKQDPYVIGKVWNEIKVVPFKVAGV